MSMITSMFKAPEMPTLPPAPAPAPTKDDEEVNRAAEEEKQRIRLMKGRSSTILTGGSGVVDDPMLMRKTLLGGT